MEAYINDLLKDTGIDDTADTPALSDLFEIEEESKLLSNIERERVSTEKSHNAYT